MTIETKYSIGDRVFIINNDIREVIIHRLEIKIGNHGEKEILYRTKVEASGSITGYKETGVYVSRYEAAKAWFDRQGLEPNDIIQSVFQERKEAKEVEVKVVKTEVPF